MDQLDGSAKQISWTNQFDGPAGRTSLTDQLDRPAGRISWTDQLDGTAGRTSWTDQFSLFEALASLHIRRLTFQFIHCRSFRVWRRPCFSVVYFPHRRSAWIKKLIWRKLLGAPKNRGHAGQPSRREWAALGEPEGNKQNHAEKSHQLHTLVMGYIQWQMDNHLESLQGEKLGNHRLLSGEKLPASQLQDLVSCIWHKTLKD